MRDIRLHKPAPHVLARTAKRKTAEQQRRDVYRQVDLRDGGICQHCGVRCRRTLECVSDRLEHHHVTFRSRGGTHTSGNVITLCLSCHSYVTTHRLAIHGNADEGVRFEVIR